MEGKDGEMVQDQSARVLSRHDELELYPISTRSHLRLLETGVMGSTCT